MTAEHATDHNLMSDYISPAVTDLGSLSDLTLGGGDGGSDASGGSQIGSA